MFAAIKKSCLDYYQEIPAHTFKIAAKSAILSFSVAILLQGRGGLSIFSPKSTIDLSRPLLSASFASLASIIYAVTAPLFNALYGDNKIRFFRELIKCTVINAAISYLFALSTASKVSLTALPLITSISFNIIKQALDLPSINAKILGGTIFVNRQAWKDVMRKCGLRAQRGSGSEFLIYC